MHHERHTLVGHILQDITTAHFGHLTEEVTQEKLDAAKKAAAWTVEIDHLLKSGVAVTGASVIPDGEPLREQLIALIDGANGTLQHALTTNDENSFAGILQRLGAQLSHTVHGDTKESGISKWVHIFETVISILLPLLKK